MSSLDVLLVAVAAIAASGGYRMGLLSRAGAWIGIALGIAVSTQVVGPVIGLMEGSNQLARLGGTIILILALGSIGQSLGFLIGDRLRRRLPDNLVGVDRAGGAAAGVLGVAVMIWLLLPTLGLIPGEISSAARRSAIVSFIDQAAPAPPGSVRELAQQVSEFPFPQVFDDMRSSPDLGPPPADLAISPELQAAIVPSTMNVEAPGCGGVQEGSAFVVEPELIATNAHVVAGTAEQEVVLDDGSRMVASVVAFDPNRDIALLSVPGLTRQPLAVSQVDRDESIAVFGYPLGQDAVRIAPGIVAERRTAIGRDIYGRSSAVRDILIMASDLQPGDSGSAVVDASGQVVGIVFAKAPDQSSTAYALSDTELAAVLASPRAAGTSTGDCI